MARHCWNTSHLHELWIRIWCVQNGGTGLWWMELLAWVEYFMVCKEFYKQNSQELYTPIFHLTAWTYVWVMLIKNEIWVMHLRLLVILIFFWNFTIDNKLFWNNVSNNHTILSFILQNTVWELVLVLFLCEALPKIAELMKCSSAKEMTTKLLSLLCMTEFVSMLFG